MLLKENGGHVKCIVRNKGTVNYIGALLLHSVTSQQHATCSLLIGAIFINSFTRRVSPFSNEIRPLNAASVLAQGKCHAAGNLGYPFYLVHALSTAESTAQGKAFRQRATSNFLISVTHLQLRGRVSLHISRGLFAACKWPLSGNHWE